MFQACVPIFFQELQTSLDRKDEKVTKELIKGLANSLRTLGRYNSNDRQFLSADQINALGPFIKGSLELVQEMKNAHQTLLSQTKGQLDLDEEDMEKIKEELAKLGKLATQTMELSGQLVEIFKDQAY